MAFERTKLAAQNGAVQPTTWTYETTDAIATVNTSGYFNDASDVLKVRDLITVFDTNAPTTNTVSVLSNASGVVDVSDGTPVAETDGD